MASGKTRLVTLGALVLAFICFITPATKYDSSVSLVVENDRTQLPLKYPFFICQFGRPRSATTFQTRLLLAISNLKSPEGISIPEVPSLPMGAMRMLRTLFRNPSNKSVPVIPDVSRTDSGLLLGVMKTHSPLIGLECVDRGYPVFTSDKPDDAIGEKWDNKFQAALHRQDMDEMEKCSLCQVDYYKPIFDLSDDEVATLREYMGLYEKVRQCCGLQMSKYNRARLHGCDTTSFRDLPNYPNCEDNNMEEIEQKLYDHPITIEPAHPKDNWAQPGDCAKFDKSIIGGNDFNNKKWDSKCPVVENGKVQFHF